MFQETPHSLSSSSRSAPRSCCQALCSMTLPDNRPPLTSDHLDRAALPATITWHDISNQPSREEPATDRYTYGVNNSSVPLLKVCESRIINPPKNAADRHQLLQNESLSTKQRAPHSQNRAGAETICRLSWIKHQILPRVCFNGPRPEGGLLIVCSPEAAEVQDVYCRIEVLKTISSVWQNQRVG